MAYFRRLLFFTSLTVFVSIAVKYENLGHLLLKIIADFSEDFLVNDDISIDHLALFKQYDVDENGFISVEEFHLLADLISRYSRGTAAYENVLKIPEPSFGDEVISLRCNIKPVQAESLRKDMKHNKVPSDALLGVKTWTSPHIPVRNFSTRIFSDLLPSTKSSSELSVGEVWQHVKPILDGGQLSSSRWFPPPFLPHHTTLHNILAMFHSRPFIYTRFSPQGTVAVLRARSDKYIDVLIRVHAEFQLNVPPAQPFWFTPAQLKGRLIIDTQSNTAVFFHLYLPSDHKLNVDMEWMNGPDERQNMEVDIGFVALMEVMSSGVSKGHVTTRLDPDTVSWSEEISQKQAEQLLEKTFYPFKEVPYVGFTEAFDEAGRRDALVHAVLLWGALDDQSC